MSKNFSQIVADQRYGAFSEQAGEKFAEMVKAVKDTGKPAELIVKLQIQPNRQPGAVTITDEIIAKAPKLDKAADFFYSNDDGTLLRSDPKQPDLPGLRAINKPQREVVYVQVDSATGEVLHVPANPLTPTAIAPQDAKQLEQVAGAMKAASPVTLAPTPGINIPPAADAAAA